MMASSNGNISALLALCEGKPPVTGGFPSQRAVTRSFDVFFDLCLNKYLSKQSRRRWFETASRSLWRQCNVCCQYHSSLPAVKLFHSLQHMKVLRHHGPVDFTYSRWRHQMETFSVLLALCAENSPVSGEFPAHRPVTRSLDVFFICASMNT